MLTAFTVAATLAVFAAYAWLLHDAWHTANQQRTTCRRCNPVAATTETLRTLSARFADLQGASTRAAAILTRAAEALRARDDDATYVPRHRAPRRSIL